MIALDCINLNRRYGKLELDHPPRTEAEFHALHIVTRGLDQLLAGEEPTDLEFIEHVLGSPEVQRRILELMPAAGKVQ
jgi:hypothetical protein